jgi:hypothetical protein
MCVFSLCSCMSSYPQLKDSGSLEYDFEGTHQKEPLTSRQSVMHAAYCRLYFVHMLLGACLLLMSLLAADVTAMS